MNRKDFISRVFGVGLVSIVGSKFGAKYRIFSEKDTEDGTRLSGNIYFTEWAYAEHTEEEFKHIWEETIDGIKHTAWPDVLKERNRLLENRRKHD